jgi:endonuclease YncB( thermonuclease family)
MDCCSNTVLTIEDQINNYRDIISQHTIDSVEKFIPDIRFGLVVKVYDGDTITVLTPVLNTEKKTIHKFSVRVRGVDCPELRSKNEDDKFVSLKAREYATKSLMDKYVILKNISYDKYGRILATVIINNVDFGELLCKEKLAVKYFGKTKNVPKNWREYYENSI